MTILFTVYLYFAVGFFFWNNIEIIDVLGVVFVLNKAIKVHYYSGGKKVYYYSGKKCSTSEKNQYSMIEVLAKISSILYRDYIIAIIQIIYLKYFYRLPHN